MPLDPYVFGDTQAAVNLADILTKMDNPLITRKTSRILAQQNKFIKGVAAIEDTHFRLQVYNLYQASLDTTIEESTLPTFVKTHIINILTARLRVAILRVTES